MVKLLHTFVTDGAMFGSQWPNDLSIISGLRGLKAKGFPEGKSGEESGEKG